MTDPEQWRRHGGHQRIVGVEDRHPVARHRLHDDLLDAGQLLERGDAAQPEVVAGDVQHDGHVVALVAEPLAQDAAAGHLEHGEVDASGSAARSMRERGPAHVAAPDDAAVDEDPVGRGHADLVAQALHDVGDHAGRGGLAVRAGDRHDRDARVACPAGRAGR